MKVYGLGCNNVFWVNLNSLVIVFGWSTCFKLRMGVFFHLSFIAFVFLFKSYFAKDIQGRQARNAMSCKQIYDLQCWSKITVETHVCICANMCVCILHTSSVPILGLSELTRRTVKADLASQKNACHMCVLSYTPFYLPLGCAENLIRSNFKFRFAKMGYNDAETDLLHQGW